MINTKGMDKARVLMGLYNGSRILGMGILDPEANKPLTYDEAKALLARQTYFDYLRGRVMKVDLKSDDLDPRLYDRDNGQGAAEFAILEEMTKPD